MQYVGCLLCMSVLDYYTKKTSLKKTIHFQHWKNEVEAMKVIKKWFKSQRAQKKSTKIIAKYEKYTLWLRLSDRGWDYLL